MSIDRKTERAAKFHRKRNAKNKQKEKKYIKEKKDHADDFKNTRVSRNTDRFEQGE